MAKLFTRFPRKSMVLCVIGLLVGFSTVSLGPAQTSTSSVWLDPDGQPLPFQSNEAIEDFLRTAEIVSQRRIGEGINNPFKVLLEKDGVQMNAVFRDIHEESPEKKLNDGTTKYFFRDDTVFDCAAYELAKLLGMDTVPPAVERRVRGTKGTLQIWVENTRTNRELKEAEIQRPGEGLPLWRWMMRWQELQLFDNLIYNEDRNLGNVLIDSNWKLWLIDHGRTFRRWKQLQNPELISFVERSLWEKLQTLDEALVKERLQDYLRPYEISGLLERKRLLVEHIQNLIAENGEGGVLYTKR
ncbi:MAG: hypothetical protein O7D93_09925 [Acidobacteria bacterium]|nr:hypothetical protein [Acidobacteriota bacterium]